MAAWLPVDKRRHTILKRTFHEVPIGAVEHDALPSVVELKSKTMTNFCFDAAAGGGTLRISQLSGDFCAGCFRGEKCSSRPDELEERISLMNVGRASTRSRAAAEHLKTRGAALLQQVKDGVGDHCFAVMDGAGVGALEPVEVLVCELRQRPNHVAVLTYDNVDENVYSLDDPERCARKIEVCGIRARPPCYRRHVQTAPLTALRPPVFRMKPVDNGDSEGSCTTYFEVEASNYETAKAACEDDEKKHAPSLLY